MDGQAVQGGVFVMRFGLVEFLSPESVDWLCVVVSVGGGHQPTSLLQAAGVTPVHTPLLCGEFLSLLTAHSSQ